MRAARSSSSRSAGESSAALVRASVPRLRKRCGIARTAATLHGATLPGASWEPPPVWPSHGWSTNCYARKHTMTKPADDLLTSVNKYFDHAAQFTDVPPDLLV